MVGIQSRGTPSAPPQACENCSRCTVGNHSMSAFVFNLTKDGYNVIGSPTLELLRQNSNLLETLLFLIFLFSFASALFIAYRRNQAGLDPYLLLICTIGALIVPVSNDYTLSFLAAPLAIFLSGMQENRSAPLRPISIVLITAIAFLYASILVPFKYKPYYLNNAFPPLFLILIFVTILNFMRSKRPDMPAAEAL